MNNSTQEKEPIEFIKENTKKNKISIIIKVIIALIVVIAGCLYFYVSNITIYFTKTNELYYGSIDGVDVFYKFVNDNKLTQYYFSYFEDGETVYRFGKSVYEYSGYEWKHLLGPFYFSENRITSLENVGDGVQPVRIAIRCEENCLYDWFYQELDADDLTGETATMDIAFSENNTMLLAGGLYKKTEDFPEDLETYVLFLDNIN